MFENLEPSDCGLASTSGLITYQILNQFSTNLSLTAIYSITITVICYSLILSHFKNSQLNSKKFSYEQEKVEEMQEQQSQNQLQSQTEPKTRAIRNRFLIEISFFRLTEKDICLCVALGLGVFFLLELTGKAKALMFGFPLDPWLWIGVILIVATIISCRHKLKSLKA
ncbi:MAG: hypothetical protein WAQ98_33720 [Blastocatellia bacterium]